MNNNITDKQKKYILEMIEFSDYPLPFINLETATRKEATEWIRTNWKLAHESAEVINE